METLSKSFRQLVQVSKSGNSLAIRLLSSVVEALGLKATASKSVQPENEPSNHSSPMWIANGTGRTQMMFSKRKRWVVPDSSAIYPMV
jgi:hypothetical protein